MTIKKHSKGLYCGQLEGRDVVFEKDFNAVFLGAAGFGKTTGHWQPGLIGEAMDGNSLIIPDAKNGEQYEEVEQALTKIYGQPPAVWAPWGYKDVESIQLNPFGGLITDAKQGKSLIDPGLANTTLLCGAAGDGNNAWIAESVEQLVWGVSTWLAHNQPGALCPSYFAQLAVSSHDDLMMMLLDIKEDKDTENGWCSHMIGGWIDEYPEPSDQFRWVRGKFNKLFAKYYPGTPLGEATSRTTFDLLSLKDKPGALVMIDDSDYFQSHHSFFNMRTSFIYKTLKRQRCAHHVITHWDEVGQYHKLDYLPTAVRMDRSRGQLFRLYAQDETLFDVYQKEGGFRAFDGSMWFILSAEGALAERLSKKAGKRAELIQSGNANQGSDKSASDGASEVLVDVLPISTIAQGLEGKTIVDTKTKGIFILDRPGYWNIPWCAQFMDNFSGEGDE